MNLEQLISRLRGLHERATKGPFDLRAWAEYVKFMLKSVPLFLAAMEEVKLFRDYYDTQGRKDVRAARARADAELAKLKGKTQ